MVFEAFSDCLSVFGSGLDEVFQRGVRICGKAQAICHQDTGGQDAGGQDTGRRGDDSGESGHLHFLGIRQGKSWSITVTVS